MISVCLQNVVRTTFFFNLLEVMYKLPGHAFVGAKGVAMILFIVMKWDESKLLTEEKKKTLQFKHAVLCFRMSHNNLLRPEISEYNQLSTVVLRRQARACHFDVIFSRPKETKG